ncbi:protein sprouty homolog 2 [Eucyclogobius newberryi]|uniref:protein sprouty homolog 2 n=1 Tax=Eucyclogobius newberryi TaxID=166745 RepID=UPI003B5AC636
MDSSRVSESDGEGGPERTPLTGPSPGESSVSEPHDPGRAPPHPPDTRDIPGQSSISRQLPVLSLDQIRVTGSSNEYTNGPTAPGPRTGESAEERHQNLRNLQSSHSSSSEGSHSPRTSGSSPSSGQRLLGQSGGSEIIRVQPKHVEQSSEELKPLTEPRPVSDCGGHNGLHKHWDRCEECGRCRCPECVRPRVLPSCWMCGRRCMCSAHSAVEYGTCVCCVKGLFYHCSSDDEDTCADKPFSCSQPHCCARWSAVSLLALLFPCLLCYLPARTCVSVCQSCYDRASRPGCRCKDSKLRAQDLPT